MPSRARTITRCAERPSDAGDLVLPEQVALDAGAPRRRRTGVWSRLSWTSGAEVVGVERGELGGALALEEERRGRSRLAFPSSPMIGTIATGGSRSKRSAACSWRSQGRRARARRARSATWSWNWSKTACASTRARSPVSAANRRGGWRTQAAAYAPGVDEDHAVLAGPEQEGQRHLVLGDAALGDQLVEHPVARRRSASSGSASAATRSALVVPAIRWATRLRICLGSARTPAGSATRSRWNCRPSTE